MDFRNLYSTEEERNRYMTEMRKLAEGLDARGIEYTLKPKIDGWILICGEWDAICHCGSYGHEKGLLETMGIVVKGHEEALKHDSVIGFLTADEILNSL